MPKINVHVNGSNFISLSDLYYCPQFYIIHYKLELMVEMITNIGGTFRKEASRVLVIHFVLWYCLDQSSFIGLLFAMLPFGVDICGQLT